MVPVLDVGDDRRLFLVMDYVEGDSLAALLRAAAAAGCRSRAVALRILLDALAGLHAAHELRDDAGAPSGLVHRDFSPQNILVGIDGVARLADFGIAKAPRAPGTRDRRRQGQGRLHVARAGARSAPRPALRRVGGRGRRLGVLLRQRLFALDNDAATLLELVTEQPPHVGSVRGRASGCRRRGGAALLMDADGRGALRRVLAGAGGACREAGVHIAEPAEVAAQASALVGARVRSAWRGRGERALRAQVERIAERAREEARSALERAPTSTAARLRRRAGGEGVGEEGHTLARGAFVRGIEEDETTRRSKRDPSAPELVPGARVHARRRAARRPGRSSVVRSSSPGADAAPCSPAMFWTAMRRPTARAGEARASLLAGVEASLSGAARAAALAE